MLCPRGARGRKGSLERGRGRGPWPTGASAAKGLARGRPSGDSARRLLPHNLMASLAEDCSTPSDRYASL